MRRSVLRWYVAYIGNAATTSFQRRSRSDPSTSLARTPITSRPFLIVARGSARRLWTQSGSRALPPREPTMTRRSASSHAYKGTEWGCPLRRPVVVRVTFTPSSVSELQRPWARTAGPGIVPGASHEKGTHVSTDLRAGTRARAGRRPGRGRAERRVDHRWRDRHGPPDRRATRGDATRAGATRGLGRLHRRPGGTG